jgi:hypothetical protein
MFSLIYFTIFVMHMKKLLSISLVLLCSAAVFAQVKKPVVKVTKPLAKNAKPVIKDKKEDKRTGAQTAEVKNINAYVKTIDALVKRNKNPNLVFADVSQTTKPKWQKFASEAALNKQRKVKEAYEIAYVWQKSDKVAQVSTTQFSQSGDWVQYLYGYYREDGSLAKLESDFRSFHGNVIVEQDRYYDKNGKQISTTKRYKDLNTQKPKKFDPSMGFESMGQDFTIYKTTKKLPFASLIAKKK